MKYPLQTVPNPANPPQPQTKWRWAIARILLVVLAVGCAHSRPTAVAIPIELESSAAIQIERAEVLRYADGRTVLRGNVTKRFGYASPSQSHLDVRVYDADGKVLQAQVASYRPHPIPNGHGHQHSARFNVELDEIPEGGRITVRHHQAPRVEPNDDGL